MEIRGAHAEDARWGVSAESWARRYVESTHVSDKIAPPGRGPIEGGRAPERLDGPGRDPALRVHDRADRVPRAGALREPSAVARLLHVFLHHEGLVV